MLKHFNFEDKNGRRWEWSHHPRRKRTITVWPRGDLYRRVEFPGLALAVAYDIKSNLPLGLFAFGRESPLTGDSSDELMHLHPGPNLYYADGYATGLVCMGPTRSAIVSGMSPEEAFWNSTFGTLDWARPMNSTRTTIQRVVLSGDVKLSGLRDPHWAINAI